MRKFGFLLLALLLMGCSTTAQYLQVGDLAPDFTLKDVSGEEYQLSDELKQRPILLYFSMADG